MSLANGAAVMEVLAVMRAAKRVAAAALVVAALVVTASCGGGGSSTPTTTVTIASSPGSVAGGGTFLFSTTATNLTSSETGVSLVLALNEASNGETTTPCTASCGVLSDETTTVTSTSTVDNTTYYNVATTALYTAPEEPPSPNSLILTATAPSSTSITATVTFTIGAPAIVAKITNKITKILPSAAPVTLDATVQFDPKKQGVTWKIAASGAACSPKCGTLSDATATSVKYTPPATLPVAPNDTPTITATAISDDTKSDFDTFTIEGSTLPISVSITNPFTSIDAGASGVTVSAKVNNDTRGQGVTWSIAPAAAAGTLSAATATSVLYTPPNLAPQPPNNTPTITATSVADPTKSASFQFTIEAAGSHLACDMDGQWAFVLRGGESDSAKGSATGTRPFVAMGSMVVDGAKVMVRAVDVNDDFKVESSDGAVISGGCQVEIRRGASGSLGKTYVIDADSDIPGLAAGSDLAVDAAAQIDGSLTVAATSKDGEEVSGAAARQDLSAFAGFGGALELNLADLASGGRGQMNGVVALEFSAGAGRLTGGSITEWNASGEKVLSSAAMAGAASAPDVNGRGTLRLEVTDGATAPGDGRHFVYYVVSSAKVVMMEVDTADEAEAGKTMETGTGTVRAEGQSSLR